MPKFTARQECVAVRAASIEKLRDNLTIETDNLQKGELGRESQNLVVYQERREKVNIFCERDGGERNLVSVSKNGTAMRENGDNFNNETCSSYHRRPFAGKELMHKWWWRAALERDEQFLWPLTSETGAAEVNSQPSAPSRWGSAKFKDILLSAFKKWQTAAIVKIFSFSYLPHSRWPSCHFHCEYTVWAPWLERA